MAQLNFDASNIAPREAFDIIKPGWYFVTITGAEMKPTKDGGAEYLSIEFEVDGNRHPELANRKLWDRLNINHQNQQPREISQRVLSAICHAGGKLTITDTDDLLGLQVMAKVTAKPATGEYDARNEIKGYKPQTEGAAPPAARPAQAAAPAAARSAPWGKK